MNKKDIKFAYGQYGQTGYATTGMFQLQGLANVEDNARIRNQNKEYNVKEIDSSLIPAKRNKGNFFRII